MTTEGPHHAPNAEIATLVMDGGTAYVLIQILGMTIDNFRSNRPGVGLARDVLIHAHDELAGQLSMPTYTSRDRPEPHA
jgi:hypothetical protein